MNTGIRQIYKTKQQEHNQPQGTEELPQLRLLPHKLAGNSSFPTGQGFDARAPGNTEDGREWHVRSKESMQQQGVTLERGQEFWREPGRMERPSQQDACGQGLPWTACPGVLTPHPHPQLVHLDPSPPFPSRKRKAPGGPAGGWGRSGQNRLSTCL